MRTIESQVRPPTIGPMWWMRVAVSTIVAVPIAYVIGSLIILSLDVPETDLWEAPAIIIAGPVAGAVAGLVGQVRGWWLAAIALIGGATGLLAFTLIVATGLDLGFWYPALWAVITIALVASTRFASGKQPRTPNRAHLRVTRPSPTSPVRVPIGRLVSVVAVALTAFTVYLIFDYATNEYPGYEAAIQQFIVGFAALCAVVAWLIAVVLLGVSFTYRSDLEQRGWHRPWPLRVVLGLVGVPLILAGLVGWALEQEYGGDEDRKEYVTSQEASGPVQVHGESGVVFEGTQEEVDAWLEEQRGSRNFTAPFLLITGGAVLILAGVAPSPKKRTTDATQPPAASART